MSFVNGKINPLEGTVSGKTVEPPDKSLFGPKSSKRTSANWETSGWLGKVGETAISTQTEGRLPIQKKI